MFTLSIMYFTCKMKFHTRILKQNLERLSFFIWMEFVNIEEK